MADTIFINTVDDLERQLQRAIDDIEALRGAAIEVKSGLADIQIHLTGPKYDGSLTTSVMSGLIEIQNMINRIYVQTKPEGHRLTNEEKRRLEMVVVVRRGSLDVNIPLDAVLSNMTGDQVLVGVAIVAVAWVAAQLTKVITDKVAEVKLAKIKERRELEQNTTTRQLYQTFENMMAVAVEQKTEVVKKLLQADPDTIKIGGSDINKEALAESVVQTRRRIELVRRLETDEYKVEALYFSRSEGTFGDLLNVKTGELLKNVNLQDGNLSEGEFALIREAEKKNPIKLGLIVERRDGVYQFAHLNNVVPPKP